MCRICLQEDEDKDNPLFSPCKCAGTMRFIHLYCLQQWLRGKKIQKLGRFTKTFYWKCLECELCKTAFPQTLRGFDRAFSVVEYELPHPEIDSNEQTFMVLESVTSNTSKVIHVVNFEDFPEIRVGRG